MRWRRSTAWRTPATPSTRRPLRPTAKGPSRAMRGALADAGLNPSEVDYINAHGTGTPNNDASESAAMLRLFGDRVPPVSSTKAFTGHTTSASGAIETVICLLALRYGFLPVNLNWQHPMDNGIVPVREEPARRVRSATCCATRSDSAATTPRCSFRNGKNDETNLHTRRRADFASATAQRRVDVGPRVLPRALCAAVGPDSAYGSLPAESRGWAGSSSGRWSLAA